MQKTNFFILVFSVFFFTACSPSTSQLTQSPDPDRTEQGATETEPLVSDQGNIKVSSPTKNAAVGAPFTVTGEARVFENMIQVQFVNENKEVLFDGPVNVQSPDVGQFGPFEVSVVTSKPALSGTVRVFHYSAKDGSEVDVVEIPVRVIQ